MAQISNLHSRGNSKFAAWLSARRKTVMAVTLVVAAIPACFATSWVLRYGVEVPTKDDWAMAPIIVKAQTGHLTWADLFEQQQEARTILPKLIFILSAAGGHWDVRELMILSVIICGLNAVGIYRLLLKTGLTLGTVALCFWLISLTIFSAAQFELWVWASCFPSFIPALLLVVALVVLETRIATLAKFAICAACATASSFTLPHGLLLWGLTFPVLLLGNRIASWRRWLAAWVALTAICAGIYFHGYARPWYHPEFAPAVPLLDYLQYFLAFLGGEVAFAAKAHRLTLATAAGAILLTLFLCALVETFRRRREVEFVRRVLPWFALAGYSIGSACLATLGRIGFGINSATASRYVAFSLYLTVALIVLLALIGRELQKSRPSLGFAIGLQAFSAILCGAFLIFGAFASATGIRMMEKTWARTRLLRGAVLFSAVMDTSEALLQNTSLPAKFLRANAADLDELKLLRPALVRSVELISPEAPSDNRLVSGKCEAITPLDAGCFGVSGFAVLNAKGRPADAVILAYETPGRRWIAFALSNDVVRRRDIAHQFRNRNQLWSGWSAKFQRGAVPAGSKISAWALDADVPNVYCFQQNIPELQF